MRALATIGLCLLLNSTLSAAKPAKEPSWVRLRSQAPTYRLANGKAEVSILFDRLLNQQTRAAMQYLVAKPGLVIPLHVHAKSVELLYILAGSGQMQLADARGRLQQITVRAGMAIWIPQGRRHGLSLKGATQPLTAIQVYLPGGPEQRFRKGRRIR